MTGVGTPDLADLGRSGFHAERTRRLSQLPSLQYDDEQPSNLRPVPGQAARRGN